MAAGRILNRGLLARVADLLNLEGVKRFPTSLDLNDIKAVIDIGRLEGVATPGGGEGANYFIGETEVAVGLAAEYVGYVIDDGSAGLEGGAAVSWRVDNFDLEINFDAAGRTAMVDKQMFLRVEIYDTLGDPGYRMIPIHLGSWWYGIAGGPLKHVWSMHGWKEGAVSNFPAWDSHTWHGRVPALATDQTPYTSGFWGLKIVIGTVDGTGLPANTEVTWACSLRKSNNSVPPNPS